MVAGKEGGRKWKKEKERQRWNNATHFESRMTLFSPSAFVPILAVSTAFVPSGSSAIEMGDHRFTMNALFMPHPHPIYYGSNQTIQRVSFLSTVHDLLCRNS